MWRDNLARRADRVAGGVPGGVRGRTQLEGEVVAHDCLVDAGAKLRRRDATNTVVDVCNNSNSTCSSCVLTLIFH